MNHWLAIAAFSLAAFAVVAALMPLALRVSVRAGFVDAPGGRKRHDAPVPPVGGLVVFPVFMAVAALSGGVAPSLAWFFAALVLLLAVGAVDDRFGMKPRIKFAAQWLAAALIVIPGGMQVAGLGDLFGFGPVWLGWAAPAFSIVAAVLLINAVNLIDGLDGLAAGKGVIILGWLVLCAVLVGNWHDGGSAAILIAALAGFLLYNLRHPLRERASVFLGDSGSMALGLALAWYCIDLSQSPRKVIHPAAVAWLLAILIFDTCGQFARRISQGRHPFDADHHHFHHHFLYAGLTPGRATAAILVLSALAGLIGVGGVWVGVPPFVLAYLWTALLFAHIYLSMRPHRFRRLLQILLRSRAQRNLPTDS